MDLEMGRKVEILAPAGNLESFYGAVAAGADAVYLGGNKFGARAFAGNFTKEELLGAMKYAHLHKRKVYLTVNTLLKNHEMEELYDYLSPFYHHGLDAVIVQDLGVLQYLKKHFPDLSIHGSTQMNILGVEGACFLANQGVKRVVLGRELSLGEIKRISKENLIQLETFVHGALCYSYSGQCLFSSLIGGRSGNRGQCAGTCRLPFKLNECGSCFGEEGEFRYYFSLKDISMIENIPQLIKTGISSFKIEGRMKSPEYIAWVTSVYRKYVDLALEKNSEYKVSQEDRNHLKEVYNRGGFSSGYYFQHNGKDMLSLERPNHSGIPAAKVLSQKGQQVKAIGIVELNKGDVLEIEEGKYDYTLGEGFKGGETFVLNVSSKVNLPKGKVLRRIRNEQLLKRINQEIIQNKPKVSIVGDLQLKIGKPARLKLTHHEIALEVASKEVVQEARNKPLDPEDVREKLLKTGNTEFVFENLEIQTDDHSFIPFGVLKGLRREGIQLLEKKICEAFSPRGGEIPKEEYTKESEKNHKIENHPNGEREIRREEKKECEGEIRIKEKREGGGFQLTVLVETKEQLNSILDFAKDVSRIYLPETLLREGQKEWRVFKEKGVEVFLATPHILRDGKREELWEKNLSRINVEGVLVRNLESYSLLKGRKILDHNLYVFNHYTKEFWQERGGPVLTAPLELSYKELLALEICQMELMIYGYLPMMITSQCLFERKTRAFNGENDRINIQDRKGNNFIVKKYCDFCYNVIYNYLPLSLLDQREKIKALNPKSLRVTFTIEDSHQVNQVMNQVVGEFFERKGVTPSWESQLSRALKGESRLGDRKKLGNKREADKGSRFEFTRGHFHRGVN